VGGGTDILARLVAEYLGARLGQSVISENRPGAGTALAAGQVARATPDGYTLLFNTAAHATNANINPNLGFDPVNDFEFVGKVGQVGLLLVTSSKLNVADERALLGQIRSEPGKHQYGSAGIGNPGHLGAELLKQATRIDAIHVPYKGEAPSLPDLISGRITFMLCSISTCGSQIQAGGPLRALSYSSTVRNPLAPTVPTVAEAGFPGTEVNTWYFIAAPKGTPAVVIRRLLAALNDVLADEKFRSRVLPSGIELEQQTSPAAIKSLVQSEIARWRPIIKSAGITAD
jgi:tripartite-type tricarboxylate transporter receptor subunit TctC